ncbi:hypothetical protein Thimo_3578 [Thioflavicoccus mobilis 8321]|uniref:Uncharacterized protein n=1 Tax=Thioflavicoccus mobilis 8321 TaxID=765912 RepID=L0H3R7_9GAMM|nr:hypothetical protein Thimo_3578 [Thioflavicoccus mobilis 8321]
MLCRLLGILKRRHPSNFSRCIFAPHEYLEFCTAPYWADIQIWDIQPQRGSGEPRLNINGFAELNYG